MAKIARAACLGHANRGQPLEALIIMANRQYRARGVAIIHKVPTAWIPIRDRSGKIASAKVEEKAAVDFIGHMGGMPVAFDAKHTYEERIRWDRVEPHQADFLNDWTGKDVGQGFILAGFSMARFFVIPWEFWWGNLERYGQQGRPAPVRINEMSPDWEISLGGKYVLDYLKKIVNNFQGNKREMLQTVE